MKRMHHDMGGLPAGRIEYKEHDYAAWERRVDALSVLMGDRGVTVDQRRRNLLKRLVATPMSRGEYLASYLISRLVLLAIEGVVLLGASLLLFGVPLRGGLFPVAVIVVVAAMAFGGLGLLIAARPSTIEGVSGLMNLTMLPMWVLSGVFFSSENFPRVVQPFIKALPLTATNDALRASMLRGVPLHALWPEFAILLAWMVICFTVALRIFRWR